MNLALGVQVFMMTSWGFSGLTLVLGLLHHTQENSLYFVRSLEISPGRTQFFRYESLTLNCGADGILETNSTSATCSQSTTCNITMAGQQHNGAYWCSFNSGGQSEAVNITVTGGSVIIESPVHPVPEGASVRLRCLFSRQSDVVTPMPCTFSRDGRALWDSVTGELSLDAVNRSDEGVYSCNISGAESPGSWLAVRTTSFPNPLTPTSLPSSHHISLTPLSYYGLPLLLLVLLGVVGGGCWKWRRKEPDGAASEDVVYADVVLKNTKKKAQENGN